MQTRTRQDPRRGPFDPDFPSPAVMAEERWGRFLATLLAYGSGLGVLFLVALLAPVTLLLRRPNEQDRLGVGE